MRVFVFFSVQGKETVSLPNRFEKPKGSRETLGLVQSTPLTRAARASHASSVSSKGRRQHPSRRHGRLKRARRAGTCGESACECRRFGIAAAALVVSPTGDFLAAGAAAADASQSRCSSLPLALCPFGRRFRLVVSSSLPFCCCQEGVARSWEQSSSPLAAVVGTRGAAAVVVVALLARPRLVLAARGTSGDGDFRRQHADDALGPVALRSQGGMERGRFPAAAERGSARKGSGSFFPPSRLFFLSPLSALEGKKKLNLFHRQK